MKKEKDFDEKEEQDLRNKIDLSGLSPQVLESGYNAKVYDDSYLKKEISKIHDRFNEVYQVIHNKGLEIGYPAQLLNDIADAANTIGIIKREIIDTLKKDIENDDEIRKELNKGNEIVAYFMKEKQVNQLRSRIPELEVAIRLLLERLKVLQGRIYGRDFSSYEASKNEIIK